MRFPRCCNDYATHAGRAPPPRGRRRLLRATAAALALMATAAMAASTPAAAPVVAPAATPAATPVVAPARIVSLSPHITELLFAVGAGDRLIGVDSWSNYPPAARSIERVGDVFAIDIERLLALKPDLVVYWKSGTPMRQQEQLSKLGLQLLGTEQRTLADIETALLQFGALGGHPDLGRQVAGSFRAQRLALQARYATRPRLRVFYQVWDRPLYTLTGEHVVNEVLQVCGGTNVFAGLSGLAPVVDLEAVLARNPDVIIVAASGAEAQRQMRAWDRFAGVKAVRSRHIYAIEPDLLNRMAPRILQGVETLCKTLDQARRRAGTEDAAFAPTRPSTAPR